MGGVCLCVCVCVCKGGWLSVGGNDECTPLPNHLFHSLEELKDPPQQVEHKVDKRQKDHEKVKLNGHLALRVNEEPRH